MKLVNGWWWPDQDKLSHKANHSKMLAELDKVIKLLENKRGCIQAGGAVGIWPQYLSKEFCSVYTFEANPSQFECLQENITANNIEKHNCALGKDYGRVSPVNDSDRCNASYVSNKLNEDVIECCPPDRFSFSEPVDFICLDLEGYELFALMGSKETIKKNKPVVQVENKHYNRYGIDKNDIRKYMKSIGYSLIQTYKYDEVYKKEE